MENTPTAPTEAPQAPASVETPITNEPAHAPEQPAVDLHGFSQDDLAGMRRFIDNNGGWDAIKQKISAPKSTQPEYQVNMQEQEQMQRMQQAQQPQPQPQTYRPPQGAITPEEFLAQQYFQGLSHDPKYEPISEQISSGDVLKEMASFNIRPMNPDGSINDVMVRRFLDLKAQTVPAKPTGSEPDASTAPTVSYTEVGENITDINQAYKVLMEPGNPAMSLAEKFIKENFNGKK